MSFSGGSSSGSLKYLARAAPSASPTSSPTSPPSMRSYSVSCVSPRLHLLRVLPGPRPSTTGTRRQPRRSAGSRGGARPQGRGAPDLSNSVGSSLPSMFLSWTVSVSDTSSVRFLHPQVVDPTARWEWARSGCRHRHPVLFGRAASVGRVVRCWLVAHGRVRRSCTRPARTRGPAARGCVHMCMTASLSCPRRASAWAGRGTWRRTGASSCRLASVKASWPEGASAAAAGSPWPRAARCRRRRRPGRRPLGKPAGSQPGLLSVSTPCTKQPRGAEAVLHALRRGGDARC